MLKNTAIRGYMFDYIEKQIAKLNAWNAGDNNAHGTILSYTDIHGNSTTTEGTLTIVGSGVRHRDPDGNCDSLTGCGTLSFGEYAGFTHYYNDCFDVKESELRAQTNGKLQNQSVNQLIAQVAKDRFLNYKLHIAMVALKAALESNPAAVNTSAQFDEAEFDLLLEKFGLSEDKLKTLVMHNTDAKQLTSGCKIDMNFKYGACPYIAGDFRVQQRFVFKTADQVNKDTAMLLVEGALNIIDIEELQVEVERTGSAGNICYKISYAGAIEIKVKGYNFDTTLASDPMEAIIGASANWTAVGDLTATAGVMWKKA